MYFVDLTMNSITRRFIITQDSRIIGCIGYPYDADTIRRCQAQIDEIETENEVVFPENYGIVS